MTEVGKKLDGLDNEGQFIVEEKIMKINGEMTIRKYLKGRFLGKVHSYTLLGRVC